MESKKSRQFSKKEAIRFGWETFKKNYKFIIPFFIAAYAVAMIPGMIAGSLQRDSQFVAFLLQVIGWIINLVVSIGIIRVSLKFYDKEKPFFSDLWTLYPLTLNYLFGSLLYGIVVAVGLVLLVIPGIFFALKFMFYSYYIVDKKRGPVDAIKDSSTITTGVKINLLLFASLVAMINILGALALGIGLLVTIPVSSLATAYVYRKLSS